MKNEETNFVEKNEYSFSDSCYAFFLAVLAFFLVSFLFSFVLTKVSTATGKQTSELLSMPFVGFLSSVLSQGAFFMVFILYNKTTKKKILPSSTLNQKPKWSISLVVALFSICILLCSVNFTSMFNYIFSLFANPNTPSEIFTQNFGLFLLSVLFLCVMPAICEELLFRGIVLGGFLKKLKPVSAVLLSAVLFALVHMSIYSTVHQFIIGVLLGMIFYITGKIIYCMIFHFINNFAVVLFTYIFGKKFPLEFSSWGAKEVAITLVVFLCGIVLSVLVYFYIKKKESKLVEDANPQTEDKVDRNAILAISLSCIFCLVFWIINSFGG